jgi:S-DNA-T family DNA segregation ATPase FtsK/SpoIIIE
MYGKIEGLFSIFNPMAKKKTKASEEEKKPGIFEHVSDDVRHTALSLMFFAVTLFFILSPLGKAGIVGDKIFGWLTVLFGIGYYIIPLLMLLLGLSFLKESRPQVPTAKTVSSLLFFVASLGIVALVGSDNAGGMLGRLIERPLVLAFDSVISFIFMFVLATVSLLFLFNATPSRETLMFWKRFKKPTPEETSLLNEKESSLIDETLEEKTTEDDVIEEEVESPKDHAPEPTPKKEKNSLKDMFGLGKSPAQNFLDTYVGAGPFVPPPVSLLSSDKGKPEFGDIKANVNIIKRTLQNFGISVEMDEVSVGPSITRYSLKPAEGVKLSRIVGLQNDLSLSLAAHPLRIEAPIPGKALVGIEIPNSVKTTVGLGSLLKEEEYQESPKPLLMALGKAINGKGYFANLAKMPHLLIAGTTGSGKSVTVHAMINSLLFRNPPENLRFIMVDPKRVELTLYNNIPHLLTPVITDPKKAIRALKWAVKEMERRYDVLETEHVRDIQSYHKNIYSPALKKYQKEQSKRSEAEFEDGEETPTLPERMPYIVVIIDELADIMTSYPRELEAGIVRLAQMSRAVGIHLILSTQRPSVNIITGLIKANVPARIALQVSSQIDSRTILDTGGAEKLLGAGDMLCLSGEMSKPVRIQSAFISENEIKKVVTHIIDEYKERLPDEIDLSLQENNTDAIFSASVDDGDDDDGSEDDDLYEEARELVISTQKASTSYLQRKLAIGYSRAARLVDILEERNVIGPQNGSKPREVYEKRHVEEGEFPEDTQHEN